MAKLSAELPRSPLRRRPPARLADIWFNTSFRYWAWQIVIVAGVIAGAAWMIGNAQEALARLGVATGLDFPFQRAGFDIGETPIAFSSSDTFARAYAVAILNTLKVSAVSIVLATLLGGVIGLARLSA